MPKQLDPAIKDILSKYHPDPRSALWDCHGTWVIYHKDVEIIAAKAGVRFGMPTVLESNGKERCVALCVPATLGDREEWSIGEASPANNKNAYPFAMAEKRARDRVTLKLIGLAGFVYSEEEKDEWQNAPKQEAAPEPPPPDPSLDELRKRVGLMAKAIDGCGSLAALDKVLTNYGLDPDNRPAPDTALYEVWQAKPEGFDFLMKKAADKRASFNQKQAAE